MTVGSLCTGVGGLDLGVHAAYGGRTRHAWYCENNPDPAAVLERRLPGVPNLGDLTTIDWHQVPPVDVLAAGFPCQPVSAAGQQKGDTDDRWLWPHVAAAITALQPQEIILENVRNLVSIRAGALFAGICGDLRDRGYAVRWATAGACAVGSCHHRHRVFIIARRTGLGDAPPAQRIPVLECGARRNRPRLLLGAPIGGQAAGLLLPTPCARDGLSGAGSSTRREGGDNLRTAASALAGGQAAGLLLPTPCARDHKTGFDTDRQRRPAMQLNDIAQQHLLPTPTAVRYGNNQGGANPDGPVRHSLDAAHLMLPTPRHTDAAKGGPNQRGSSGDLMLPSAVVADRYGRYAPAVALWEQVTGMAAPEPTMRTKTGWRLSPHLPEWMMGYPPGWITDVLGRNPALRCAGNGVVAQVVAAVYPHLTAGWAYPPAQARTPALAG